MTADDLLAGLKNRASLPPFQLVWTDANLLKAMQEEVESQVVPVLYSTQQDFFTDFVDLPLVANQQGYRLPQRAMGDVIRGAYWVDTTGIVAKPPLLRVNIDEVSDFTTTAATIPKAFFLVYDQINVLPTPSSSVSGSIRLFYLRRPGILVSDVRSGGQSTQVGVISAVTSDTVLTMTVAMNGWANNQNVDIVQANPQFALLMRDQAATLAASGATTITIAAGGLSTAGISAGDYVTLSQQSYVPQIPREWHPYIEVRTAAFILESLGDLTGADRFYKLSDEMRANLMKLVTSRTPGNPLKANPWK